MVQALYGGLWSELALGLVRNAKRAPMKGGAVEGKPRRAEGNESGSKSGNQAGTREWLLTTL